MIIGIMRVKLYAPWVHSLKEKRMIVKSIVAKVKNRFNVSITEIEEYDIHKTIVIGISLVSINKADCDKSLNKILDFMEVNTEAEIISSDIEII